MTNLTDLTLHIDPACPWAWLTSRWLVEVEKVRPIRVTTRLFVLAEINRETEPDARRLRFHRASETAMRIMITARRTGDNTALTHIFTELGDAHHEHGAPLDDDAVAAALESDANHGGDTLFVLDDQDNLVHWTPPPLKRLVSW